MKTNRIIRLVVLSTMMIVGVGMTIAQESVLMLMQDVPQQIRFNPALATSSRSYFTLPGLGGVSASLGNTGFSFEDMYVYDKKSDEWRLNLDHLAKNFKGNNSVLHTEVEIPLIATGVRLPKGAMFWSVTNRSIAEVIVPKGVLDLRYGNYDYDKKKTISHDISDIGLDVMNFHEIAFGGHYDINEHFSLGATIKYLSGLVAAHTDNVSIKMETLNNSGKYSIHVVSKGQIDVSAPLTVTNDEDDYVDDVDLQIGDAIDFMTKNAGFAFDLGARLTFLDKRLKVGISVVDLGYIKWKVDNNRFVFDSNYTYTGKDVGENITDVNKDEGDDYWDNVKDELLKFKDMKYKSSNSFKTTLSPKVMAFGQWEVKKWFNVGAVASLKFVNGNVLAKTTANISLRPNHHFDFIFSTGMHPGTTFGVGAGIQATAGPFQFLLASEKADFNIKRTKGAQVTFGINWLIGAGKGADVEEEAATAESIAQPAAAPAQ